MRFSDKFGTFCVGLTSFVLYTIFFILSMREGVVGLALLFLVLIGLLQLLGIFMVSFGTLVLCFTL